jgi:hypothetical protein
VPRSPEPQISFADWELLQQGIVLDAAAAEHLRFSGRPPRDDNQKQLRDLDVP